MNYQCGLGQYRARPTPKSIARHAAEAKKVLAADPDLAAALTRDDANIILEDLGAKLERYGVLSEKQVAFAKTLAAQLDERAAKREAEALVAIPVTAGKRILEGTIASAKWHESYYGTVLKCTLKTIEGERLWGTVPKEVANVIGTADLRLFAGVRVTFTATVEVARDNKGFGFWSRPTKAAIVGGAS